MAAHAIDGGNAGYEKITIIDKMLLHLKDDARVG